MLNIIVRRPTLHDKEKLHDFFQLAITDTFIKEGIDKNTYDLNDEIQTKKKYLQLDLESDGKQRFFLIAELDGNVVGTIEYGKSSNLISSCTNGELDHLVELGTVFVRPDLQNQGVGSLLIKSMEEEMLERGIEEFCLDSGYSNAQKIWIKKFGKPTYLLQNYWGEGMHHMIWRIMIR